MLLADEIELVSSVIKPGDNSKRNHSDGDKEGNEKDQEEAMGPAVSIKELLEVVNGRHAW